MEKHICNKCGNLIFEKPTHYPKKEIIVKGTCGLCLMKPDEKRQLKRDAEDWRNKKKKEIINKKNPTEIEKHILNLWSSW